MSRLRSRNVADSLDELEGLRMQASVSSVRLKVRLSLLGFARGEIDQDDIFGAAEEMVRCRSESTPRR